MFEKLMRFLHIKTGKNTQNLHKFTDEEREEAIKIRKTKAEARRLKAEYEVKSIQKEITALDNKNFNDLEPMLVDYIIKAVQNQVFSRNSRDVTNPFFTTSPNITGAAAIPSLPPPVIEKLTTEEIKKVLERIPAPVIKQAQSWDDEKLKQELRQQFPVSDDNLNLIVSEVRAWGK